MSVIDHGEWELYTPEKPHPAAPAGTMYARRIEDGRDWYNLAHNPENFYKDSVKLTIRKEGDNWVTMAATRDQTGLFPAGCLVVELEECPINNRELINHFSRLVFNREEGTFGDRK